MSRDYGGSSSVITTTIAALDAGSWTAGCWIYARTSGPTGFGCHFDIRGGTTAPGQLVQFASAGRNLRCLQGFSSTHADAVSSTALDANRWYCVFGTYRGGDQMCRIHIGSLTTPVAEASYSSSVAGSGSRLTGKTSCNLGSTEPGVFGTPHPIDGLLSRPFLVAEEWPPAKMEAYRLGRRPIRTSGGAAAYYWPLDSPTASQALDMSGAGAHGTVTACTAAEEPAARRAAYV